METRGGWGWGRGGVFMKNQYRNGDYLKRGAWMVCRFNGGGGILGKNEMGWCFLMGEGSIP